MHTDENPMKLMQVCFGEIKDNYEKKCFENKNES